ncbi:hypothetical protein PHLGIDRAFT_19135 [Phlebiopsis gigantea 11061_1 CR5-6]|uniref:SHSP domain-containing protein n=1 Tax=Phlebiopsis gigantea (strain 11061_1 CR5-6) TaxID=745531 RepID=A0A0C3RZA4_PHLG1|nr:hypothetical protein PHLGIDRAFT_19135 [Phlebiopsis gigantea 11061_1 CR5-6]
MDATSSELTLPADPDPIHTDQSTLDPVWEEVREQKAKILAGLPSKVKSLEGMVHVVEQPALEVERPRLRRKNSAEFGLSPDGKMLVATFDMTDVGKQDMHVSFKADKVIVTWRKVRIVEKQEDGGLVRERREKQYSQIIPLAEGTSFKEVRAARSGNCLVVTYPNLRCVRVNTADDSASVFSSGETDFDTCVTPTGTLFQVIDELMIQKT